MADLFKLYLEALGNEGLFYRRPLAGSPPRYGIQAVGVNKLKSMMKIICDRAGLKGNFTNHSGKKTCATALYQSGIDEQDIMGRTGHRSEMGVRAYKRSNADIACKVSKCLDPPPVTALSGEEETSVPIKRECVRENQSALRDITNLSSGGAFPCFNNCSFSFH
ncbi:uncharacterized protein LOC134229896 [Saccostrea cucullata]|uniref:uncharacterized protein LOC134229896 n=1 Tax=Saccostrea cuccullata TaxID=36930 RepID=UPI002ED0672C